MSSLGTSRCRTTASKESRMPDTSPSRNSSRSLKADFSQMTRLRTERRGLLSWMLINRSLFWTREELATFVYIQSKPSRSFSRSSSTSPSRRVAYLKRNFCASFSRMGRKLSPKESFLPKSSTTQVWSACFLESKLPSESMSNSSSKRLFRPGESWRLISRRNFQLVCFFLI